MSKFVCDGYLHYPSDFFLWVYLPICRNLAKYTLSVHVICCASIIISIKLLKMFKLECLLVKRLFFFPSPTDLMHYRNNTQLTRSREDGGSGAACVAAVGSPSPCSFVVGSTATSGSESLGKLCSLAT